MAGPARRRLLLLGVAALGLLPACGALDRAQEADVTLAGALPAVCRAIPPDAVGDALGVSPSKIAGPLAAESGTCTWHSTDPSCYLRSLGVEVHTGPGVSESYSQARDTAALADDVHGIGQRAFFSAEPFVAGAAVQIAHLDVDQGDTWLHVTLLGRVGPAAEDILQRVATAAVAAAPAS